MTKTTRSPCRPPRWSRPPAPRERPAAPRRSATTRPAPRARGQVTTTGGDASKVTLRVGVQKDGIRSILAASGALKGVPYKIDWSIFAFGPPLVEAAGADKIDVAGVGDTPPIFGAAGGSDFRVIATERFDNRKDDTLLVPKGSDITDPEQLKGKTIAVPKGSSAHGFTLRLLDRLGLKPSDVKLSFLAPADALAAFSSGKVDAWAVWEPFVTQAEEAGARGDRRRAARRGRLVVRDRLDQGGRGSRQGRGAQGLHLAPAAGVRLGAGRTRTSGPTRGRRSPACRRRPPAPRCPSAWRRSRPSRRRRRSSSSRWPTR